MPLCMQRVMLLSLKSYKFKKNFVNVLSEVKNLRTPLPNLAYNFVILYALIFNAEGFNEWYKGKFTDNKRLPLNQFLPAFFESIVYISERYNPVTNPFPTEPKLSNTKKVEAQRLVTKGFYVKNDEKYYFLPGNSLNPV